MVTVDSMRCAYCGGCVSVCPVGVLALAETRLLVGEECTGCGRCVAACPMGALQPTAGGVGAADAGLRSRYDVVVVGAGPGGSQAAYEAARAGLSVLLLEKRQEIGSPVRCAEGVAYEQLVSLVEPQARWIAATITRAEIATGDGAQRLQAGGGHGYVLERRLFDRYLAERAAQAGATVLVKTAATGLVREGSRVRGVRIRRSDRPGPVREVEVEAGVVIAADGAEARVGCWAGLKPHLPLADTMACAQYLLAGVDIDPACTAYTLGYEVAPGGYAWVFPKGDGLANVGLGVQAGLAAEPALAYLQRFIEGRPHLACGYAVTLIAGSVPVGLPPSPLVADGLLVVGDAARQVDPLTGGGIVNALAAGRLAAQTAAQALEARDTSAAFLRRYEEAWQAGTGRKMQRNYRLRQRFAPEQRSDERFLRAFALAVG